MTTGLKHLFIGIDGGATKCVVQVENAQGEVLGRHTSGPVTLRFPKEQVWRAIHDGLAPILSRLGMVKEKVILHAGVGIAGCEAASVVEDFKKFPHGFKTLVVMSDAHTACLGAHGGQNGAIIIAGTGSVGFQIDQGRSTQVGGWGFPHDDEGSGAWIGLEAIKKTVKCLDGRTPHCALTQSVLHHFSGLSEPFIEWMYQARASQFAALAPLVIQQAQENQHTAVDILKRAAQTIDAIGSTLEAAQISERVLPCVLQGGVAPFLKPYLSTSLQSRLCQAQASPEAGAILFLRRYLEAKQPDETCQ